MEILRKLSLNYHQILLLNNFSEEISKIIISHLIWSIVYFCTIKPVLSKHLWESQKVIAKDRCLHNTGKFTLFPFMGPESGL